MKKIRKNAFVVFDKDTISSSIYEEFYAQTFDGETHEGKLFIYLGEVPQTPSHCILADLKTGLISGLWHTENFREATEDEC